MKKLISVILAVCLLCIFATPGITSDAAIRYNYLTPCGNTDTIAGQWAVKELTEDESDPTVNYDYTVPDGGVTLIVLTFGTQYNCAEFLQNISQTDWISNEKINVVILDIMFSPVATRDEMATLRESLGDYASKTRVFYNNPNPGWIYVNDVVGEVNGITPPVLMLVTETDSVKTVEYYGKGNMSLSTIQNSIASLLDGVPYDEETAVADITVSGDMLYDAVYEIHDLVNQNRADNSLSPLALSDSLTRLAMLRAAECSVNYSHTRPNGESCFTVDKNGIYTVGYINAENIAAGQTTAASVMNAWMNSSGHRRNILNTNSGSIGIGVYRNAGRIYWVQLFGTGADQSSPSLTGTVHMNVEVETNISPLSITNPTVAEITLNVGESAELPIMKVLNPGFYNFGSDIIPFTYENVTTVHGSVIASVRESDAGKVITGLSAGEGELLLYAYEGQKTPYVIRIRVSGGCIYGDADGDGRVTGRDLIRLRKYLSSEGGVSVSAGADANGDGVTDGRDIIALKRYLAGYDDETNTSDHPLGPQ